MKPNRIKKSNKKYTNKKNTVNVEKENVELLKEVEQKEITTENKDNIVLEIETIEEKEFETDIIENKKKDTTSLNEDLSDVKIDKVKQDHIDIETASDIDKEKVNKMLQEIKKEEIDEMEIELTRVPTVEELKNHQEALDYINSNTVCLKVIKNKKRKEKINRILNRFKIRYYLSTEEENEFLRRCLTSYFLKINNFDPKIETINYDRYRGLKDDSFVLNYNKLEEEIVNSVKKKKKKYFFFFNKR